MSILDINSLRDDLLMELAKRRATNGSPQCVAAIFHDLRPDVDWTAEVDSARSAGWLLVRNQPPLAKTVVDASRPGAMLLALTAAGKSKSSELLALQQPRKLSEIIRDIPRSDWIALGAFITSVIALFRS